MNITGSFDVRNVYLNGNMITMSEGQNGAFYKQGDYNITYAPTVGYQNGTLTKTSFNASKSWTGETSAVGGGKSHTHGIKNIAKIKKYDKIKLRNTSLKVNLGLVPFCLV